jgi:rhodanese-related sulfurtransferase
MIETLKKLMGIAPKADFHTLVAEGAVILDVRTKREYNGGHIKGAVNIPLDQLSGNLNKFKDKSKTIITCCASGTRSSIAKGILLSNGYTNVHNGGGWMRLNSKI